MTAQNAVKEVEAGVVETAEEEVVELMSVIAAEVVVTGPAIAPTKVGEVEEEETAETTVVENAAVVVLVTSVASMVTSLVIAAMVAAVVEEEEEDTDLPDAAEVAVHVGVVAGAGAHARAAEAPARAAQALLAEIVVAAAAVIGKTAQPL